MVRTDQRPGTPVSLEPIGGYPHPVLRTLFWRQGVAKVFPTEHGIELSANGNALISVLRQAAGIRGYSFRGIPVKGDKVSCTMKPRTTSS